MTVCQTIYDKFTGSTWEGEIISAIKNSEKAATDLFELFPLFQFCLDNVNYLGYIYFYTVSYNS